MERTRNKRSAEISAKREDEKQKISRDFNEERGREKKKEDQQIFQRRGNVTLESAIKAVKEDGPEMTFYNHYTER